MIYTSVSFHSSLRFYGGVLPIASNRHLLNISSSKDHWKKYDNVPGVTSSLVLSKKEGKWGSKPFAKLSFTTKDHSSVTRLLWSLVTWSHQPGCGRGAAVGKLTPAAGCLTADTSGLRTQSIHIWYFAESLPEDPNLNMLTPSALLHLTWVPHFYIPLYYHFSWFHHSFMENNFTHNHFLSLWGQNWSNPLLEYQGVFMIILPQVMLWFLSTFLSFSTEPIPVLKKVSIECSYKRNISISSQY